MGKHNGPYLPDVSALVAAGINPKTGLPYKLGNDIGAVTKDNIKRILRVMDEQDAVNMFKWYNLPTGVTGQDIERWLYYKYTLCTFYLEGDEDQMEDVYHLPYALDGSIDLYGKFNKVHPVPMASGSTDDESKKVIERQRSMLANLKLKVLKYPLAFTPEDKDIKNSCVLIKDYTPQANPNYATPMADLIDPILDQMAEVICYLNTALMMSTGIRGMRVNNTDESSNVEAANVSLKSAALNSRPYVAIVGACDFQDLTEGTPARAEEYLMTLQSLDNLRKQIHGISGGGWFQKQSHMLESENQMNAGVASLIAQDKLTQRQNYCMIFNSLLPYGTWCELSEPEIGVDKDMDGEVADNQDDQYTGGESNEPNDAE